MAISFLHTIQEATYRKIYNYLVNSLLFQDTVQIVPDSPAFRVRYGSAVVDVDVYDWEFHPWEDSDMAIVRASSCLTTQSQITPELMQFLLIQNQRMRFGAFHLDEQGRIFFADSIVGGENMDLTELQACILAVAAIADSYDDLIVERFGGFRAIDAVAL
jgi:hypothetical protein